MKTWKTVLLIVLLILVFAVGLISGRFPAWQARTFGKTYVATNEEDCWELRRFVYLAVPVLQRLERAHEETGHYPESLGEMRVPGFPDYFADTVADPYPTRFPSWHYQCESNTYTLYMKLNWDGGLYFDSGDGSWFYDPGDGRPSWPVISSRLPNNTSEGIRRPADGSPKPSM